MSLLSAVKIKHLKVDVFSGFVYISGLAPAYLSRNDLTHKILDIEGVISVRNRLKTELGKKYRRQLENLFYNPNI